MVPLHLCANRGGMGLHKAATFKIGRAKMTFPAPLFDTLWNLVLILSVCASNLSAC
jgi:hypothetical protein